MISLLTYTVFRSGPFTLFNITKDNKELLFICSYSVAQSCLTLCDLWDCSPPFSLSMGFPSKNTGVGWYFLLQGIFPTQGSNPRLLHWQADSSPLSHWGSPSLCGLYLIYINSQNEKFKYLINSLFVNINNIGFFIKKKKKSFLPELKHWWEAQHYLTFSQSSLMCGWIEDIWVLIFSFALNLLLLSHIMQSLENSIGQSGEKESKKRK